MDKRLHTFWENKQYPFNQKIFHLEDLIPLEQLYKAIVELYGYFYEKYKNNNLFLNHDWHEHDRYVNESVLFSWNEFRDILKNPASLFDSRDEDTHVRISIYPDNLGFVLRYNILEEDEDIDFYPGIWGEFELICDKSHSKDVIEILTKVNVKYSSIIAWEYFEKS